MNGILGKLVFFTRSPAVLRISWLTIRTTVFHTEMSMHNRENANLSSTLNRQCLLAYFTHSDCSSNVCQRSLNRKDARFAAFRNAPQVVVGHPTLSRNLDVHEEIDARWCHRDENLTSNHQRIPVQDHRVQSFVEVNIPQCLESPASPIRKAGTDDAAVKECTQHKNLPGNFIQSSQFVPSVHSSNIMKLYNDTKRLAMPSREVNFHQTSSTDENQNPVHINENSEQDAASINKSPQEKIVDDLTSDHKRTFSMLSHNDDARTNGAHKMRSVSHSCPAMPSRAQNSQIQVRKEKLGEKIIALQRLVSPFGKTDTASVLLEAIGYIKFLQEQVRVLSSAYKKPKFIPKESRNATCARAGGDQSVLDLRSRGLCLVPMSSSLTVVNNRIGADYWSGGGSRHI